jgi:hypothetical protein
MADRSGGTIAIRLAVKDGEVVKNALRQVGAEGTRALKVLEDAGRKPTAAMLALNEGFRSLRGTAEGFAGQLGPASGILSALGPAGTAAAVGLGGAGAALMSVRNAAREVSEIRSEALTAGIDPGAYQELAFAAGQYMVSTEALTDGIKELQLRADEFATTGTGSGADAFKRLGFSAAELSEALKDPVNLFGEVIERTKQLDKAAQIRVFDEVFGGTGGEQFTRLLDESAGSLSQLRAEARRLGVVLGGEVFDEAAQINREFTKLGQAIDVNIKGGIIGLASDVRALSAALAAVTPPEWLSKILAVPISAATGGGLRYLMGKAADLVTEKPIENTELRGRSGMYTPTPRVPEPQARPTNLGVLSDEDFARVREENERKVADATRAHTSAVRDNEAAERDRERLLQQAARTKLELGDITGALAQEERELGDQLRAGVISQDEYTAALARRKKELLDVAQRAKDDGFSDTIKGVSNALHDGADSIKGALLGSASWTDALEDGLERVRSRMLDVVLDPAFDALFGGGKTGGAGLLGSAISAFAGSFGGSSSAPSGTVPLPMARPFARGGAFTNSIVSTPTLFPFANGTGLMGEAGPEAIMPLRRDSSGRLGVSGGGAQMNVHIHPPAGYEARQERTTSPDGGTSMSVFFDSIEREMASRQASGRGELGQSTRAMTGGMFLKG